MGEIMRESADSLGYVAHANEKPGFFSEMARTAPGLLIAMPDLSDPNFHKSVVLMLEHSAEGALGLVINRPTPIRIETVFDALELEWRGEPDVVVWTGGPVMREVGWILHGPSEDTNLENKTQIVPDLFLSTTSERMRQIALKPPEQMRFILGAAGWGPGQLENELGEGAWMTAEPQRQLIFDTPCEEMWDAAFKSIGIDPMLLRRVDGVH